MVAAGALGGVVMMLLGPQLAMLAAMYGGNTLPDTPSLAYPWVVVGMGLASVVGGALLDRGGHSKFGLVSAHGGAVLLAVLPFLHLWRLVGLTGEAMP